MAATRQLDFGQLAGAGSPGADSARNQVAIEQCPRCGSTTFRDFPARLGEWIGNDCARCNRTMRFIAFSKEKSHDDEPDAGRWFSRRD
jgi:hypothetical protein